MQLRFTMCRGMFVYEQGTEDLVGMIDQILIDPDTGGIEGFFVSVRGVFSHSLFVRTDDVVHMGTVVKVRSAECLCDPEEIIRLQPLLQDPRRILGQSIVTQGGQKIGRCKDIQFETKTFRLQWLFPRTFLRWGVSIPASHIIEVKEEAIIVKNLALVEEATETAVLEPLPG